MLYEDDVTDAVCSELERRGWTIEQRLRSTERGDDIVATRVRSASSSSAWAKRVLTLARTGTASRSIPAR